MIPRAVREDQRLGASVEREAHPGRRIRNGILKKAAFEGEFNEVHPDRVSHVGGRGVAGEGRAACRLWVSVQWCPESMQV